MEPMPVLESLATALPPHLIRQEQAVEIASQAYRGHPELLKLVRVFPRSGVERRYSAFPPEYYATARSFDERNRDFIEQALVLAERAARAAIERAGVSPREIDHLILVTTTGLATPSLDALLVARLGLRDDVRRWPLFGLGCAGGAGALSRAVDLLRSEPSRRALVVSVELCGQIFTPKGLTPTDVIGAALFGDGAAAALVAAEGKGPRILSTRTHLYEGTQGLMGWSFTSDGMRLVLSKDVAAFVKERLRPVVEDFVGGARIAHWVLHPGGRKILETYGATFGLPPAALRWTRESLAKVGNLSSASILFILSDLLESGTARAGDLGLMVALGPGFASELLLLEW